MNRRELFKIGAGAAAAAVVTPIVAKQETMPQLAPAASQSMSDEAWLRQRRYVATHTTCIPYEGYTLTRTKIR